MGSAAAEAPHHLATQANDRGDGLTRGAELVAGMVEHVIGKNAEGELVGGQGGQRLIVST